MSEEALKTLVLSLFGTGGFVILLKPILSFYIAKKKVESEASLAKQKAETDSDLASQRQRNDYSAIVVTRLEKRMDRLERKHEDCEKKHDECQEANAELREELGSLRARVDSAFFPKSNKDTKGA